MIYVVVLLASLGMFTTSCEKEDFSDPSTSNESLKDRSVIDQDLYPQISVINNVLSFESIEYFTSLVSNETEKDAVDELTTYLQSTAFSSYGKKYGEESEYEDSFMDAIMNEQKVVKIGEWYIYIDLPTETVLALSATEANPVQALLEHSNRNIKVFSTGDDVVHHLADGTSPDARACGGIGGGVYPCYTGGVHTGQVIKTFTNGVVWRLNPFTRFFRAGIYYRLSSQYEVWRFANVFSNSGGQIVSNISQEDVTIEMFIRYPQAWWKKRPCNSSSVGTKSGGFHYSDGTYGNQATSIYLGTRNLNGYYCYVQGRARYDNGTVTTASPYGGRNINSPY